MEATDLRYLLKVLSIHLLRNTRIFALIGSIYIRQLYRNQYTIFVSFKIFQNA